MSEELQPESLYLIDKVGELNTQFAALTDDDENSLFSYKTDGFTEVVEFAGVQVYNTENDDPCYECLVRPCPPICHIKQNEINRIIMDKYKEVVRKIDRWQALVR